MWLNFSTFLISPPPQERVRQIEDKALSKLRRPWRQKLLRPHLYTPGSARDA